MKVIDQIIEYQSEILGVLLTLSGIVGFIASLLRADIGAVQMYVSAAFSALGIFVVGGLQLKRLEIGEMTATFDAQKVVDEVQRTCPCEYDPDQVVDAIRQSDVSSLVMHGSEDE